MRKFVILLLVIIGVLYVLYKANYPTYSWHQKIAVEVRVPNGSVVTGYTVTKVVVEDTPNVLSESGARRYRQHGEAMVMQLPNGRYLFALLPRMMRLSEWVFADKIKTEGDKSDVAFAKVVSRLKEKRVVPPKYYPVLATFEDIADPKTVRRVDPADLAATLGEGYALERITLEITDDPTTFGQVEMVLDNGFFQKFATQFKQGLKSGDYDLSSFFYTLSREKFIRSYP